MAKSDPDGGALHVDQADVDELTQHVDRLQRQEDALKQRITQLQDRYDRLLQQQAQESQMMLTRLVSETMAELSQRRQALQLEVEQLERRRDRIQEEMRTNFAGVSQDLAIRMQGFKDYLVGSLQDLAAAAEQVQLAVPKASPASVPVPLEPIQSVRPQQMGDALSKRSSPAPPPSSSSSSLGPQPALQGSFDQDRKHIQQLLDQYRHSPNYYGTPWQLRRTFEPIHAKRVSQWFFTQVGRGSLKSMGSRLQNILVASAIISVLRMMKGDRIRLLILSDSPERLGEWRRGLQDCLGISRSDFGAQQGIALFEAPEAVCQRADRLIEQGNQPLILIDNSEDKVHLSLLQYPLWLAFAPDPRDLPVY